MPSKPTKVALEIVERYRLIRALHACYYTRVGTSAEEFGNEFFFLVGDVIEGKPIDESRLRHIQMERVREFLQEER